MQSQFSFRLFSETDHETGKLLAVYFRIRRGKAADVEELANGAAFANYDRKGRLLGVELLAPCEIKVFDKIASDEPAPSKNRIRRFLKDSIPRKMALCS